jgi:hypothetical protein
MIMGMFLEYKNEVLDDHRAQPMIDSPYFDTVAGARIGSVLHGHQDLPGSVKEILVVRRIVVPIAQDKTCFDR